MKTLIVILILAAFLQTTLLRLDLVLLILILRTFIKPQRSNFLLAFLMGLLVSLLSFSLLGIHSLVYLTLVYITEVMTRRAHISDNILVAPFLTILMLTLSDLVLSLMFHQSFQFDFMLILWETVVVLPIYLSLKFWEERFRVTDIKLKM